ncbi:ABC transporter ATP-binding protein [Pararhizobium sp. YC-54]|uniref:ABC transporter ATP-binding protein n=1 Tax=Pararhizobium sp. YC-54 TaxID=2986920 RepID=UPI0021F6A075|nr:ABC transporter ATP-binding protein [Pararhizobium sp. YC-54]MCV9999763.1 ABC transporter ATP-binding protein [Pararhizobium sp. YC-54]
MNTPALDIRNLSIGYAGANGIAPAVEDFNLAIAPGEFVGLAGESGCGKSTVAQSILRLLKSPGVITGGEIRIDGTDILTLPDREVRNQRWNAASIVLQNSLTSLNPVKRIAWQLQEVIDRGATDHPTQTTPQELLEMVGIDPNRARAFPHELSGGMRQRVVIAMALALRPKLIILDEPTTALDVIVQQGIFRTLREFQERLGFAVLLITHDLPLLYDLASRIAVMKDGKIVETASVETFRHTQNHAYSRQLVDATPRLDVLKTRLLSTPVSQRPAGSAPAILDIHKLCKSYLDYRALDEVTLRVNAGEIVAIVGESGSGKSTLGRIVTGLTSFTSGSVSVDGKQPVPVSKRRHLDPRPARMVFQDVYGSLNPLHTIEHHLRRAIRSAPINAGIDVTARIEELLEQVGLTPAATYMRRRPHELSGGQRQRVGLARALASRPRLLVADEPISMLDVSIRLDVLKLIGRLRDDEGVAVLYITHDIVSAGYLADRIVVMYRGQIVEEGAPQSVLGAPRHQYTKRLIAAIPGGHALVVPTVFEAGAHP